MAPEKTRRAIKTTVEEAETTATPNRYAALIISDSEEDSNGSNTADSSDDDSVSLGVSLSALPATERRRLERAKILRSRMRSGKTAAINPVATKCLEPAKDREAKESPEAEQCWQSIWKEYDGLTELGTWKLVKAKDVKKDHGNKPLMTKDVYKRKVHAITKAPRFRVHNCVRGFKMIPGVHFDESFVPTPTTSTHQITMELSLYQLSKLCPGGLNNLVECKKKRWIVGNLFDVVQAFLMLDLDHKAKPLYIYLPPRCKEYCEA